MPRFSVYSVRAALLYLTFGFTIGGLLLFHKGIPLHPILWTLLPAHIDFLLIGWTAQLIMGVSFWILPRFSQEPKRGKETLAWIAFILLNLGIWLVALSPYLYSSTWMVFLGRLSETLGILTFAVYVWPRIKPTGA
jgi:heme/copper-type cytochrome/quinol oxidase subunit 1